MSNFQDKEARCLWTYKKLGPCFHLWTSENFEIIFRNDEEFRIGMGIVAIAAKLFPQVKVITFELMTNHIHLLAAGLLTDILEMFDLIKKYLKRMASSSGRTIDWCAFKPGTRLLESLADVRNVLVYDNRNGFLVHSEYTPFSYPWGANSCFFNPDSRKRFNEMSIETPFRARRALLHSHLADSIRGLRSLDNYISPFSFCDIDAGEHLFRDAVHYFYALSKSIEQNKEIAKEIGESISFTEDELYAAISVRCKNEYGTINPAQIPSAAKIELAKLMRYEYNATMKQIQRMLRMDRAVLQSLYGDR